MTRRGPNGPKIEINISHVRAAPRVAHSRARVYDHRRLNSRRGPRVDLGNDTSTEAVSTTTLRRRLRHQESARLGSGGALRLPHSQFCQIQHWP